VTIKDEAIFRQRQIWAEIRQAAAWGVIDGVTTNPSLAAREEEGIYGDPAADL